MHNFFSLWGGVTSYPLVNIQIPNCYNSSALSTVVQAVNFIMPHEFLDWEDISTIIFQEPFYKCSSFVLKLLALCKKKFEKRPF
jgi:hypothetical protein